MSIEHLAIVLNHSRSKGTARIVLMGLANHASVVNNRCWPSVSRLRIYTGGMDRTSILRALDNLENLGEIMRIRHGAPAPDSAPNLPKRNRNNLYEILLRCPDYCDGTPQHRDRRRPLVPDEMMGDVLASEVAEYDFGDMRSRKNDDSEVAPVRLKPSINHLEKVKKLSTEGTTRPVQKYDPIAESRLAKARALADPPAECQHGRVAIVCPQCNDTKENPN